MTGRSQVEWMVSTHDYGRVDFPFAPDDPLHHIRLPKGGDDESD